MFYSTTKDYQQVKDKKDDIFNLEDYQKKVIGGYLHQKLSLTIPDVKAAKVTK